MRRFRLNPFLVAKLQLVIAYFIGGSSIYIFLSWFVGSVLRKQLYAVVLSQNGVPAQTAVNLYESQLLVLRIATLLLFGLFAYLITEFALQPVKRSADLQKRFIAIVSHELRTPLTIMRSTSDVALRHEDLLTKERAIDVIRGNLDEIDRISNTLQFLLTFSDLRNRNRETDLQAVSLTSIVKEALPRLKNGNAVNDDRLVFEAPAEPALIRGNATALEGMLTNLVNNAFQHAGKKGVVRIAITQAKPGIQLSVSDSGTGISKKNLPHIFEPFYRGEGDAQQRGAGVGLGLSIVKEIAELHHATVRVESAEGTGSTFTILFPA